MMMSLQVTLGVLFVVFVYSFAMESSTQETIVMFGSVQKGKVDKKLKIGDIHEKYETSDSNRDSVSRFKPKPETKYFYEFSAIKKKDFKKVVPHIAGPMLHPLGLHVRELNLPFLY
ncbi:uncharacterized protein [Parasteatoda tepidariorum]|uniref:uncharacterized protein n=1 Tax=Parasteatoda tepidariorum TaxID=114398 RepID=UPI00077F8786|nr:uncharacterized protein LOC107451507 [Parasteatoda tepidariorum]